jgi:hypothetical protein
MYDHFQPEKLLAAGPVGEVFSEANIQKTYSRRAFAGPHGGHTSHELAH